MRLVRPLPLVVCILLLLLSLPALVRAHGFAGRRFFPTTLALDDPFVSDELSFLLRHTKEPGRGKESPTLSTEIAAEYPVNPGLIWFGKFLQLGVEATIPINERTGKHVGVLGLVHVFIDDLFPHSLGRPIFP